jgi:HlyD family secretion protein
MGGSRRSLSKVGQNVPAGAVLVQIDNPETLAKHEQMKAAMAVAEAQLANVLVGTRAAAAAVTVLERRLDKMVLRAPADGVVSVVAAEVGENVRAGQPILMVEVAGNTLRLRLDPEREPAGLEPGMTVWIENERRAPKWRPF